MRPQGFNVEWGRPDVTWVTKLENWPERGCGDGRVALLRYDLGQQLSLGKGGRTICDRDDSGGRSLPRRDVSRGLHRDQQGIDADAGTLMVILQEGGLLRQRARRFSRARVDDAQMPEGNF